MTGQYSDSEFDSELEEIETNLYQQLYFNDKYSQLNKNNFENITSKSITRDGIIHNLTKENDLVINRKNGQKTLNFSETQIDKLYKNTSNINQICEKKKAVLKDAPLDSVVNKDDTINKKYLSLQSSRIRTASICSSVDSISGKIPLDDLYLYDLDDELFIYEEENDITERGENIKRKKKTKTTKIKKTKHEDSKYSMFTKLKENRSKRLQAINESSDSDEITIISPVPPTPKSVQVVDDDIDNYSSDSISILEYRNLRDRPNKTVPVKNPQSDRILISEVISSDSGCSESDFSSDAYPVENDDIKTNLVYNTPNFKLNTQNCMQRKTKLIGKANKPSCAVFSKHRPVTKRKPGCEKWTQEMASLYDSDELDEFSVEEIHSAQSDSPLLWQIDYEDLCPRKRPRYFNKLNRCNRCREEGHLIKDCPKKPHCLYCGSTDHSHYRACPQQCCLRCGEVHGRFCEKTHMRVTCYRCGLKGHDISLCPDWWRRFHVTTSGSVAIPSNVIDKRKDRYCYNCAKQGHIGSACRARATYLPVPRDIYSYEDLELYTYKDPKQFEPKNSSPLNESCSVTMMLTRQNFLRLNANKMAVKAIEVENDVRINAHTIRNICKVSIEGRVKNCKDAQHCITNYCEKAVSPAKNLKFTNNIVKGNENIFKGSKNDQKIDWGNDFLGLDMCNDKLSTAADVYSEDCEFSAQLDEYSAPTKYGRDMDLHYDFEERFEFSSFNRPTSSENVPDDFVCGLQGRFNSSVEKEFEKFPETSPQIKRYVTKLLKQQPPNRFIKLFRRSYKDLKNCIGNVYQNSSVHGSVPSNKVIIDKFCAAGSLLSVHLLNKYHYKLYYSMFKKLVAAMKKAKNNISYVEKRAIGNCVFNIYMPELSELKNVLNYGEWVLENKEKVKTYFKSRKSDGSYDSKVIKGMRFFNPSNKDYFIKLNGLEGKNKKKNSKSKKRKTKRK